MKMADKTDRELVELAARAAGLDVVMTQPFIGLQIRNGNLWRPLDDDGDALRLAVRMQLRVFPQDKCCYVESCPESLLGLPGVSELEMHGNDPHAATRRAIVRAAASIGEQMPLNAGERVAQLVVVPCYHGACVEVGSLEETMRGDGAYGSTGA